LPDATPAAGGPAQQQAPFGSSPAAGPTPNRGYEAAAAQRLGVVIKQLESLLPLVGSASEIGKDVLKMLNIGNKHVPAGSVTPAAERQNVQRMAMQNTQNQQLMQQMRPQAPGGGAAPAQASMGGAA
jgi:hypothetical protein